MKKLVAFTTAVLVILLIILGVVVFSGKSIESLTSGMTGSKNNGTEEGIPDSYYDGDLLRFNVQKENIEYEGRGFNVQFPNPFYEEGSENCISCIFYDAERGFLLESLGKGDNSEFFNCYKTVDGCNTWTQCHGRLWFDLDGENYLQIISPDELIYIVKSINKTYDVTTTKVYYSPDLGDSWTELDSKIGEGAEKADLIEKIDSLTLEQKVAMLFMLTPEEFTGTSPVYYAGSTTQSLIEQYPISGMIYTEDNIQYGSQLRTMLDSVQSYAIDTIGYPMLLAVAEEGGDNSVLSNNGLLGTTEQPISGASASARAGDGYAYGTAIGSLLKEYSFNMDLAPVADVLGGNTTQMGSRCFSTDARKVSEMSAQMMQGLRDSNVLAVMKYFPGYGTAYKPATGYPSIKSTKEAMMNKEFLPYINMIGNGVQFIQMGNVLAPEVTGDNKPASLSKIMITDILRGELGFQGVVMTDCLNDENIQAEYTSEKAAVAAIKAGADIIVSPANFEEAYNGILKAVKKDKISEERIDQSVYRILNARASLLPEAEEE